MRTPLRTVSLLNIENVGGVVGVPHACFPPIFLCTKKKIIYGEPKKNVPKLLSISEIMKQRLETKK